MTSKEKAKYRTTKKWINFRKYLLKKHNHSCMCCGVVKKGKATKSLQVHHLHPENYTNEKEKDVVLLCASCHKEIHRFLQRKEFDIDVFIHNVKIYYLETQVGEINEKRK